MTDLGQGDPDPASLWPSLSGLLGPASPQLWAWALGQYGQQRGDQPQAAGAPGQDAATPAWMSQTPPHLVWADAVQNAGRTPPGGAQSGTGQAQATSGPLASAPGPDGSAGAPTSAMAAADAPVQDDAPAWNPSPADAGPTLPAGAVDGAAPASSVAVPAAARVPVDPASADSQARQTASALNPSDQFLRPELSAGADSLVAALAGDHPNDNPFGFVVDPNTGSVSRWRLGGDPQHPGQATLQPVGAQDKQTYLEWLTGARANYPLGQVSPEELTKRFQLQQGALPGAKGPPISATASGRTVTYRLPDGSTYPLTNDRAPVRDQNPRDIEWGAFARRHGAIGADGKMAIFPSEHQAYQASMALMSSMAGNGREAPGYPAGTLANIVYQWSPPKENNTEGMIKDIMARTGFDRNSRYEALTPEQKDAFSRAYAWREGYVGLAPDLPATVR